MKTLDARSLATVVMALAGVRVAGGCAGGYQQRQPAAAYQLTSTSSPIAALIAGVLMTRMPESPKATAV